MGLGFFKKNEQLEKEKAAAKAAEEAAQQAQIAAQEQALLTSGASDSAAPASPGNALLAKVQSVIDTLKTRHASELAAKQIELDRAMTEGAALVTQFETLQKEHEAVKGTIAKLESDRNALQKAVNEGATSSGTLKAELDTLKATNAAQRKQLDDANAALKAALAERDKAISERDAEIERSSTLQDEIDSFQSELGKLVS